VWPAPGGARRAVSFEGAGGLLERLPGPPVALFAGGLVLVAGVTAVLNLDTVP
jgi:hypothetical protein